MPKWSSQTAQEKLRHFSDDPEIIRKIRIYRLKIAAVVLTLLIGIAFFAKPAYHKFREYRIDQNLEAARFAVDEQDWDRARTLSRSVLMVRPGDFSAFRIWFQALSEMEEPRAYLAAAHLFVDARASHDEKMDAFRVIALQGPQALVFSAFLSLEPEVRNGAEAVAVFTEVLLLRGEIDVAEKRLRESSDFDKYPPAQLALVRVLCARPEVKRIAEARKIFVNFIEAEEGKEALAAMEVLGEAPGGLADGPPLPDLEAWVALQPSATVLHRLLALHPRIGRDRDHEDAIFKEAGARFITQEPGIVGEWLVRHEQFALAADLLEDIAPTHPTAFIARLHALLRLNRFDDAVALMDNAPSATNPVDKELISVAVARGRGDRIAEVEAWQRALFEAAFDSSSNRFIEIAEFAGIYQVPRVAEDAWISAMKVGWGRLPLYRDLRPLCASLARQNRTLELLSVFSSLIRFEGNDLEVQNNYHYLALLHHVTDPDKALLQLERLATENPDSPQLYSAACFAALMDGKPELVLEWAHHLADSEQVPPMLALALQGTALVLTGKTEKGRVMLEKVDYGQFLHQENANLRNLLIQYALGNRALPSMEQLPATETPEETPAWKKAVERMERARANEILPALPVPAVRGSGPAVNDPMGP